MTMAVLAGDGQLAEAKAEAPGGVVVEIWEAEFGLLAGDDGQVFGDGHWVRLLYGGWVAVVVSVKQWAASSL